MEKTMARQRAHNQELFNYYKNNPFALVTFSSLASNSKIFKKSTSHIDSLRTILNDYELDLTNRLQVSPFAQIYEMFNNALKNDEEIESLKLVKSELVFRYYIPDNQSKIATRDYSNVLSAINEFNGMMNQAWRHLINDKKNIDLFRDNFEEFAGYMIGLIILERFKKSSDYNNFQASLMCLAALLRIDFLKLYAFCDSQKYSTELLKLKRKVFVRSTKEIKAEVLALANDEADEEWKKGDYRMHYEMSRKLAPKYKIMFKEKLLEAALYSNKNKVGMYRHENKYNERVKSIDNEKGECKLTIDHINKGIRPAAEKHNKYFDTGKEYREKEAYYK